MVPQLSFPNNISLLIALALSRIHRQENTGSSCVRIGCRTGSSNLSTISSSLLLRLNTLIDQPWKIISIANRGWAAASQSI